jgi:predicted nucleic acid-binding protein
MGQEAWELLINMGWFLDTSLFMDFIQTNVRVGFDKAEDLDGKTILHIQASGTKRQVWVPVIMGGKRFAFELTKNIDLLQLIHYSHKTNYYYSELTKAEVLRALRRAHPERDRQQILRWWEAFRFLLLQFNKIELDFTITNELSTLALDFPIRKNVQDYIHLITAKQKGLAYITSDKLQNQLEDLRTKYYPHIYFWPEIKDKIPIAKIFRDDSEPDGPKAANNEIQRTGL